MEKEMEVAHLRAQQEKAKDKQAERVSTVYYTVAVVSMFGHDM